MKFVIATEELNKLLKKLQNVVAQNKTIPILSNFLMEVDNGMLTLTATDLTVGMRCQTPVKVMEGGGTTLPARHLQRLVNELTVGNVELCSDSNESSEIVAGSSRFKLRGMSQSEYPTLPDLAGAAQFRISEQALHDLFYRTSFAVSREDNRYVLTGVLVKIQDGKVTFVGTDGKRLAKAEAEVEIDPGLEGEYIVPFKAVEEILKGLNGEEESQATVYLMNDKVAVETQGVLVVSKLLVGDYPDVERVIPQDGSVSVSLHRDELITLLRQVALFMVDSSHSVRFTFADGELILTANNVELGEGRVSMPVNYTGARLDIAFNPGFFLDILRHCRGETVELQLTDSYNPGKLRDADDDTAIFVIMPMRLNEE